MPFDEVCSYVEEIRKSVVRWNEIREGGCNDPFWPDGTNMNLVRNHIIYYQNRIRELCEENGIIEPDELFWELPPEVSNNLYIGDRSGRRFEMVSNAHEGVLVYGVPDAYEPYKEGQICLF